jgi:hypothetical protein
MYDNLELPKRYVDKNGKFESSNHVHALKRLNAITSVGKKLGVWRNIHRNSVGKKLGIWRNIHRNNVEER